MIVGCTAGKSVLYSDSGTTALRSGVATHGMYCEITRTSEFPCLFRSIAVAVLAWHHSGSFRAPFWYHAQSLMHRSPP